MKFTLHAMAPLLYPFRRYPKCPWGLYTSPPPVAMAVVGLFLCFPAFFLWRMGFFSPYAIYAKKKKGYTTYTKKNFHQKNRDLRQKKSYPTYAKKK